MAEGIGNLSVDAIRAKLELSWSAAAKLMDDIENPILTDDEKRATACRWKEVTHEGDLLAFALDLIRRQRKESISHEVPESRLRA